MTRHAYIDLVDASKVDMKRGGSEAPLHLFSIRFLVRSSGMKRDVETTYHVMIVKKLQMM